MELAIAVAFSVPVVCGAGLVAWRWWLAARREERQAARDAFDVRVKALEIRIADAVELNQRVSRLETANTYSPRR
jgi:predicted negative regulator of RcsB-dependent stress response